MDMWHIASRTRKETPMICAIADVTVIVHVPFFLSEFLPRLITPELPEALGLICTEKLNGGG
jgi:hypothetical protein